MKIEQSTEKQCKNCKNFVMYYANNSGRFSKLLIGHCVLDKRKKRLFEEHVCDLWENNETQKQNRREKIENSLLKMAENLDHFVQILEEEKS